MQSSILIVENNEDLAGFLKEFLIENSFRVEIIPEGLKAIQKLKRINYDAVLLDLNLDDVRGEDVCKSIREFNKNIAIIIITGEKSINSIVNCLNEGADDYVVKPFNNTELLARIKSKLRRLDVEDANILRLNDIELNIELLTVKISGEEVNLTIKEFELLKLFLKNIGRILSRDKILTLVWGYSNDVESRVVDVHIGKLNKKISKKSRLIESVRGFGYRINDN